MGSASPSHGGTQDASPPATHAAGKGGLPALALAAFSGPREAAPARGASVATGATANVLPRAAGAQLQQQQQLQAAHPEYDEEPPALRRRVKSDRAPSGATAKPPRRQADGTAAKQQAEPGAAKSSPTNSSTVSPPVVPTSRLFKSWTEGDLKSALRNPYQSATPSMAFVTRPRAASLRSLEDGKTPPPSGPLDPLPHPTPPLATATC